MRVGDYVRTINGKIYKIIDNDNGDYIKVENEYNWTYKIDISNTTKSSPNILKLLEPMDLLYVDIDGGFEGGIIVPRIPETQNELNEFIEFIKSGHWILKDIVTHEQLKSMKYEVK